MATLDNHFESHQKITTNRILKDGELKKCTYCHKPVPKHYFAYDDCGHDIDFCAFETCYTQRQFDF